MVPGLRPVAEAQGRDVRPAPRVGERARLRVRLLRLLRLRLRPALRVSCGGFRAGLRLARACGFCCCVRVSVVAVLRLRYLGSLFALCRLAGSALAEPALAHCLVFVYYVLLPPPPFPVPEPPQGALKGY